jgi:uncharacterized protein
VVCEVMWWAWDEPGLGHLRLAVRNSVVADGVVLGVMEGRPFRIGYEVRCDANWRVRSARVGVSNFELPEVDLLADGEGNWTTPDGLVVPELEGCIDVDIFVTPFTNTLPIRRLSLAPGESADISVAYFDGNELQPWPEPQRYTCLEKSDRGGLYRFLSLDGGFTADLPVDAHGLVLDYPGLFRRAPL